ncbi:uncharacterized protein LOC26529299 [Drosophila willistoni]|nr:uncharacterized protein LOC26529299 [Drosophila willistoni]
MSLYPNLLAQPFSSIGSNQRQNTNPCPSTNRRKMEGLGNCCYFFDLKTGCQLISLVEALSSMLQIYQSYSELYEKQMAISSIRPVVTTTTDVSSLSLHHVHEQHPMYNMGMGTVTILSALLLFFGVKFQRKMLLLAWIYITILCILSFMLHTLVTDLILEHVLLNAISLVLESYFIIVVLSFYLHLHSHQHRGTTSEVEVLYTGTSEV